MTSTVLVPRRIEELRGTAARRRRHGAARRVGRRPDGHQQAWSSPSIAVAFGVFIALGEVVRITPARRPRGGSAGRRGRPGVRAARRLRWRRHHAGRLAGRRRVTALAVVPRRAAARGRGALAAHGRDRPPDPRGRVRRGAVPPALRRRACGPLAQQERWVQARRHGGASSSSTGVFDASVSALRARRPQPLAVPLDAARRAARPARARARRSARPASSSRWPPRSWACGPSRSSASRCCSPSSRSAATPRSARPTCRPSARCRASPRSAATPRPATPGG